MTKYIVRLTEREEEDLKKNVKKGKALARDILRARILLDAHSGIRRKEIAERLGCSYSHVCNTIREYSLHGVKSAISDRKRNGRKPKLKGKALAHVIALACSEPPEGNCVWTMQLLADKCIELNLVEGISHDTIGRTLKKMKLNLGKPKAGVFQS